ncbi:MAG: hypothetical protein M0Q54_06660 [Pigmentiphaga sp.]|nr:hypothetical protein [Pigmentiphaga sp.]
MLTLTTEGRSVCRHLSNAAIARNAVLIEGMTSEQLANFLAMMDVFIQRAQHAVEDEL